MSKDLKTCFNCSRWKHPTRNSACNYPHRYHVMGDIVEFKHHPNGECYCDDHKPHYKKKG